MLTASASEFGLIALNKQAEKARIEKKDPSPYLFFAFSKEVFEKISSLSEDHSSASLTVNISLDSSSPASGLAFGFLYASDFASSTRLKKTALPSRPLVQGTVSAASLGSSQVSLSFAFPLSPDNQVKGFFIYAEQDISLISASLERPFLGWSYKKEIPGFGFSGSGGIIPASQAEAQSHTLDFSSGSDLGLPKKETYIRASFRTRPQDTGTIENRSPVVFDTGAEVFTVLRSPIQTSVHFYTSQFSPQSQSISITRNKEMVTELLYTAHTSLDSAKKNTAVYKLTPLISDPGLIVLWDQQTWRTEDFELFSWELFPSVLIMDFKNYAVQDEFLRRLAFFVEKKGYTGRLISDEELGSQHGFNAHDYRPESLASFFALADEQNFPLNDKELLLRHILLEQGILKLEGSKIVSGEGALLSISKESTAALRYTLLGHECLHGIYFTHEEFRTFNAGVFKQADQKTRDFLIGFFTITPTLNYDIDDRYLIENEFMAYLLQQNLQQTAQYFINMSNRGSVLNALPELSSYIRETKAQGFIDSASVLQDFLFTRYGLTAGRLALVSRIRR